MTRRTTLMLLTALLLGACGGGDDAGGAGPTAVEEAFLAIIDPGVDVADAGTADAYRPGEDGEDVVSRDKVRTAATGFAEVNWTTGALARIGPGSIYEVVSLADEAERPDVVVRLDVGRTWNRLDEGAVGSYAVETSVGTAAVRGTAFDVNCAEGPCTLGVVEGGVSFTTSLGIDVDVRAGEQVTIDANGVPGEVVPLVVDDWIRDNVQLDEERRNFPGIDPDSLEEQEGEQRPEEAQARMDGQYFIEFEVTESTDPVDPDDRTRRYTFDPECEDGPCGGSWDTGAGPIEAFTWTGAGYTAAFVDRENFQLQACTDAGVPSWLETFAFTITPTAFEVVDGQTVVTAFEGGWDVTFEPHPEALEIGCNDPGDSSTTVVATGVREGPVPG